MPEVRTGGSLPGIAPVASPSRPARRESRWALRDGAGSGKSTRVRRRADLILVHPAMEPRAVQRLLPEHWPDGSLIHVPRGYREISHLFPGLRAFLNEGVEFEPALLDRDLPGRVQGWVDQQARRWDLAQVLATRDLNYWAFLRDEMVRWMCSLITMREHLARLMTDQGLLLQTVGIDRHQRLLLKAIADQSEGVVFRPEMAFVNEPITRTRETATERRARKLFFLLQDAWHGIQFLVEDLFLRRPKVLLVSDSRCWMRRRGLDGSWSRTDVHLEAVWREGRRLPFRLYYRSDSYHPDVGAMTGSKLPPVYWRHLLFLLAHKSRGALETRSIQRAWRTLRAHPELRESLVFEGLDISDLMIAWLDEAVDRRLPEHARDTRRESHFLRGVRPHAILMTHEGHGNRPILQAAKKLGIPTVGLQLRPGQWSQDLCLGAKPGPESSRIMPDRLCVFTPEAKGQLVQRGILDPSTVAATGDPRLDTVAFGAGMDADALRSARARWGVEKGQKVLGLACRPEEHSLIMTWLGTCLRGRDDAFLLLRLATPDEGEIQAFRQSAIANGLSWMHPVLPIQFSEGYEAMDVLLTTQGPEVAEGILHRLPVIFMRVNERTTPLVPDPGMLVKKAVDERELCRLLQATLEGRLVGPPADEAWRDYVRAVFGSPEGGGAQRVIDTLINAMQQE